MARCFVSESILRSCQKQKYLMDYSITAATETANILERS